LRTLAEVAGLYYELHGAPNAPPLILSSGIGGSASYWAPNIVALAEHFHVIAYDHRGTGRSDRALPHVNLEADVVVLMDALRIEQAHFIGHAAGAAAGLALALDWAQRLDRLVLVNGWARPDPHFIRCFEARLALLRNSGIEAYVRAQPIFLYPAEWSSQHSAALDREAEHQIADFPSIKVVEQRIDFLRRFDISGKFGRFDTPMLALAAADDMLVPASCSRALANHIPACQFALMERGGHACNITDPATFNRLVLEFLRS
jgi:aminoacrylate hydrolase